MLDEMINDNTYSKTIAYASVIEVKKYEPNLYYIDKNTRIVDISTMTITLTELIDIYFLVSSIEGWFYETGSILDIYYNEYVVDYLTRLYYTLDAIFKPHNLNNMNTKIVSDKVQDKYVYSSLYTPSYLLRLMIYG